MCGTRPTRSQIACANAKVRVLFWTIFSLLVAARCLFLRMLRLIAFFFTAIIWTWSARLTGGYIFLLLLSSSRLYHLCLPLFFDHRFAREVMIRFNREYNYDFFFVVSLAPRGECTLRPASASNEPIVFDFTFFLSFTSLLVDGIIAL